MCSFFLKKGTLGSDYIDPVLTHAEQGSGVAMPQDAFLPSPDYRLLLRALQLLGYVTAANSSSVRRKQALLCLNPWDNLQGTTCSVRWIAASSPLAAQIPHC